MLDLMIKCRLEAGKEINLILYMRGGGVQYNRLRQFNL